MSDFNLYKIVGFDLRQRPVLDLGEPKRLGDYWPTDFPEPLPYPPTISEQTWPRSARLDGLDYPYTNGIDLFWLPDAQFLDRDAVSVAFSLRAADAQILDENSWISPLDEGYLAASLGWRLLGYDVANSCLGYSGFYGFTWKPGELRVPFADLDLVFNRRGLLDNEPTALRVAEVLTRDPGTKGHGPFYPVRVWAQGLGPVS